MSFTQPCIRRIAQTYKDVIILFRRLQKLEFELPRDPDEQKEELLKITIEEHFRYIHPNDLHRIEYYLTTVRNI